MLKAIQKRVIYLLWGVLALVGFVKFIKIGIGNRNFSNNIVYFSIFFLILVVIEKALKCVSKKIFLYALLFSLVLSTILTIGAQIEYLEAMIWTGGTLLKIIMLGLFLIPFIILGINWCVESADIEDTKKDNWCKWKVFVCIFSVWVMTYLALFPGIYDYDSIDQTLQFLVTGNVSSHHPVLHSFILSAFLKIGKVLFNSYQIGLAFYSLVQLVFLAFVAVEVSFFLYIRNNLKLFYLSLLFYMFFPLHYIMSVWAVKDTFFSGTFVLVSLVLIQIIESKGKKLKSHGSAIRYILLVTLMCMLRNNGMYALLVTIPICIFTMKKRSVKVVTYTTVAIVIYIMYQNTLLPLAGVASGNIREMLSVPCQQLAKVYVESPEVYTDKEKELLLALIPENNIMNYQYRPMISDATKNFFNTEEFKENPKTFVKMYINIGLKSPRKYIEAFLTNSLGFWYPNKSYPDDRMYHPYTEFSMADPELFKGEYIYIERSSKLPLYEKILSKVIKETGWENIPLFSNFFVPGTYFLILCFALMICIYQKNFSYLTIIGFWLGLWFTLLISPVALIRYAYPVVFCLPLIVYTISIGREEQIKYRFSKNVIKDKGDRNNG